MIRGPIQLTRREVLCGIGAAVADAATGQALHADGYRQADTSWFAACRFGVSTHWTAQCQRVGEDDWAPFEETVSRFSPANYVDQIAGAARST